MSHATRSQKTLDTSSTPLFSAEAEFLQKQLSDRERRIKEQGAALQRKREELNKVRNPSEMDAILHALKKLQTEFSVVRELTARFDNLEQRVGEISVGFFRSARGARANIPRCETITGPLATSTPKDKRRSSKHSEL